MKRAEIEFAKAYRVEIGWREFAKAIARETGVGYTVGLRRRTDGVRVELAEDVAGYRGEFLHRAGELVVIPTRKVQREWTPEDDEQRAADVREKERKAGVNRRLGEAGYARDTYADDEALAFHWRGPDLVLSPALTAELLDRAGI